MYLKPYSTGADCRGGIRGEGYEEGGVQRWEEMDNRRRILGGGILGDGYGEGRDTEMGGDMDNRRRILGGGILGDGYGEGRDTEMGGDGY